jgi:hypothetical protein
MCPVLDQWYPSGTAFVGRSSPFALSLTQNQIYFPLSETAPIATNIFVGYSSYAAYWAGGNVLPDQYANAAMNVQSQSTVRGPESAGTEGRLVPNGPEIFNRARR